MLPTLFGIEIEVSLLLENTSFPIFVSPLGSVSIVSWFSEKANSPILTTFRPMTAEANLF